MAVWNSSSLVASDDERSVKKLPTRISKQNMVEHKMFGSKRKNILIGKKFKKHGKGVGSTKSVSAHTETQKGISPSLEQYDKMMDSVVTKKGKKSMFSRKSFD